MGTNEKPHISSIINNWTQCVGIFLAGCWALYTFVYLQIWLPSQKESYFKIDIVLEKVGENKIRFEPQSTIAILATITGKNTSQKKLSIVSGYLEIRGDRIFDKADDNKSFDEKISLAADGYNKIAAKYFPKKEGELIFISAIFSNWEFESGESNTIYRMVYLPKDMFDHIEANAWALSGPNASSVKIKHKAVQIFNEVNGKNIPTKDYFIDYIAVLGANGNEKNIEQNSKEFKEIMIKNNIGKSSSNCYLSLWDKPTKQ